MAAYTRVNLKSDVEDMAPQHGIEGIESRFARRNLDLEKSGQAPTAWRYSRTALRTRRTGTPR
jgi:hypothetical protein